VAGRSTRVQAMFAAIAGRYDLLNHLLSFNLDRWWRARALRALQLTPRSRGLDVCCGTGDLAVGMRRQVGRVVGVDFCREMLVRARLKSGPSVDWVEADALRLPFADASFDAVCIGFGLRNLDDYLAGLRSMLRVLKPDGRLAVLEFSLPTWPPARRLYYAYLRWLLPRIGRWISRTTGPYDYLQASVSAFPDPGAVAALMQEAGLVDVQRQALALGTVTLYTGRRAAPPAWGEDARG
jgi:demethylmenaquinone methyltransferase/2-methoxy-6-polyprenyl-1,4-benzoquinol methylase